jgi:hypothetical protein
LPGATVRVEHLVDGDPPPTDVLADAAGHWDLPNIAGGRYRVRAFLPPGFAQLKPEIFFLDDGKQQTVDLAVDSFSGVQVTGAIAPDPPEVKQPFDLTVRVARRTVGLDGVVHSEPIFGAQVSLTNTPGFNVKSPGSATANTNGDASFTLECNNAGSSQVDVTTRPSPADQPETVTLTVSACTDPSATSATDSSSSSSSGKGKSSSSDSSSSTSGPGTN